MPTTGFDVLPGRDVWFIATGEPEAQWTCAAPLGIVSRGFRRAGTSFGWDDPLPTLVDRLTRIFTWWNGQTFNTAFFTKRHGEAVGTDQFGNVYYRTIGGAIDPALGFQRRWVIYPGYSEPSTVPPGWYGWLHHTTDVPPPDETYVAKDWQKPHRANMTGTPEAWRPPGSTLRANARPPATGDYESWSPEG